MTPALFLTLISASLLGSTHCAGMCGPIVLLTLGRGVDQQTGKNDSQTAWRLLFYHLGRLSTYLLLGLFAGLLGASITSTGSLLGWQRAAAYFAGITMLLSALVMFLRQIGVQIQHLPVPQRWVKTIYAGFRWAQHWPSFLRSWWVGFLTTWIPCGWLYAFIIVAAGTSDMLIGSIVMFAFWLGTVPVLSLLGLGMVQLSPFWKRLFPWVAMSACLVLSWSMLFNRSVIKLDQLYSQLSGTNLMSRDLQKLNETKLPCCNDD